MMEFGTYLKAARESAGLTLEQLHDRTRISQKNLRLIESGDFPSIPQTYVRAFVREYARNVGLDEEEIIARYNEEAEREKGIPPPPAAIDSSNLLPKVDDTVEFLLPSERPTSHVEVVGRAEVESYDFVPPVRKSSYVKEGDAAAIDIRTATSPEADRAVPPPAKPAVPKSTSEGTPTPVLGSTTAPPQGEQPKASQGEQPKASQGEQPKASQGEQPKASQGEQPKASQGELPKASQGDQPMAPQGDQPMAPQGDQPMAPQGDQPMAPQGERSMPSQPKQQKLRQPEAAGSTEPLKPKVPSTSESGNEKRIIGIGLVVIVMLAIAVYGIVYFSSDDTDELAAIDSTSIKASIEAGRFIDSSQYALTELDLVPEDTAAAVTAIPPDPVEAKPRVFSREDSLVLEAFTSAPVWFSVKMDTLRTERGSLSSNEHRVWKARDHFVITLGDAGAVTFFLNGREIGTLGEEGAVVKNVTLSRQNLNGN